jgi:hypothetical protein
METSRGAYSSTLIVTCGSAQEAPFHIGFLDRLLSFGNCQAHDLHFADEREG